ncbi:MAG TPA: ABC transporter permease [Acidimicrobiia bacterium]|jgi:ABC-type transport system involved in multi-copper enzyme maturation permease subunit|nr:ABC transporter permease [Acidimicrobiia bacterium]
MKLSLPGRGRPLNPVLARELKERMRRKRSGFVLTVYLVLLSGALWLLYLGASAAGADGPGALRLASLGRAAFQTLLFVMLLLVCFIVPGLAAGGVAGERERQTLVPLQVTLLRPRSILLGKLGASLAFVVFLVFAALPLIGVSFLLGGVEPGEVVKGVAMVLAVAATVAALALTCSTLMRRVQGATVMSYALVCFLLGGTFIAFGAEMLAGRAGPRGRAQLILALNPLMATADVVSRTPENGTRVPSPFTPLQALIGERTKPKDSTVTDGWSTSIETGSGFGPVAANDLVIREAPAPLLGQAAPAPAEQWKAPFLNRAPMWLLSLIGYGALSFGGLALASRRLSTPAAGER